MLAMGVIAVSLVGGVSVKVGRSGVSVVTTVSLVGGVSAEVGRSGVSVVTTVSLVGVVVLSRTVEMKVDQGWAARGL